MSLKEKAEAWEKEYNEHQKVCQCDEYCEGRHTCHKHLFTAGWDARDKLERKNG